MVAGYANCRDHQYIFEKCDTPGNKDGFYDPRIAVKLQMAEPGKVHKKITHDQKTDCEPETDSHIYTHFNKTVKKGKPISREHEGGRELGHIITYHGEIQGD